MSHADMNNCSGFNEAAAAFSWNSPKKAINPYLSLSTTPAIKNATVLKAYDIISRRLG